jgi:TonB-dependent receptor
MRRCFQSLLLMTILFNVLWVNTAAAQEGKGTIAGNITDSTGAVLVGAQVSLEPDGTHIGSDAQGRYFINGINTGSHTVTISYVGFTPVTQTVNVVAGQTTTVDAKLTVQSASDSMVVTAERLSAEAEAINVERTSDNLVQILPAEVIRSLPNANLADALGRLPSVTLERDEGEGKYVQIRGTEPRLTNTTIDGVNIPSPESGVRQIKFDSLPADIVGAVQINKTLQANMDGDGIGGSVNLVSKTATERPTISLSGMGGYMPIVGGRGQVETAGTIGQRFGSQKKLGVLIGGSYDWSGRGIDDIEPVSDINTTASGPVLWKDSQDIREYRYYRTRWGLAGSTDYKLGEGSSIYARSFYSDFKNYGDRWAYSLNDNSGANVLSPGGGTPSFSTQDRRHDIAIANLVIGGRHEQTTTWESWDISASRSRDINVAGGQGSFDSTLDSSNCQYDPAATTNIYIPKWTAACFTEIADPTTFALSNIKIGKGKSAQVNLQGSASMAKRYHIGSHLSTLEFGGRFRNEHKFDDTYVEKYAPTGSVLLSQFSNDLVNNNYYGGNYKLSYNPNYQKVLSYLNSNPSAFTLATSQGNDYANYNLVEKVSAGYLMNTIDFSSRIRFIAGVRFEGTNLRTLSWNTVTNTFDDKLNGSYLKVLPSASLRYSLNSNTDIRFVYARGLSRPDPQDIAQAVSYTLISNGSPKNLATLGNANLKPETGDNFDILVQHDLTPFGMIEGGFFYKRLTDPIVTVTHTQNNYTPAPGIVQPGTFDITQPLNVGSAWITGFEIAYLQHFTFLPGKLGGLGLSANYGYTASRANGLGRTDSPRLLRNAPNTWNISPTYDRGRLSIRMGLSYNQANIYSYASGTPDGGFKGPMGDTYFYSHLQVDAQGSYGLGHGLSFVMYGLNLTNEVFGFYQGSPQYMIQREYYQPTVAMGFRWSPQVEK